MSGTVLITGCSTGIGRACVDTFALNGWNVVATMRQPEAAGDLVNADNLLVSRLDVTVPASIDAAIAAAINRFGDIDVVVNNAGFAVYGIFETVDIDDIRRQFETNVIGVINVMRAILPRFRQKRSGTIVNVSSGGGLFAVPAMSIYCASKFAVEGFSEGVYHELRSVGVAVKLVEPGGVLGTPFDASALARMDARQPLDAYQPFLEALAPAMAQMRTHAKATAGEVAQAIYAAAIDRSDRLRYVATDDIRDLVRLRQEGSEDAYMNVMRSFTSPR